jgi:hypothetical protein
MLGDAKKTREFPPRCACSGGAQFPCIKKKGEPLGPPRFLFADYRYVIFGISIGRFNPQPTPVSSPPRP